MSNKKSICLNALKKRILTLEIAPGAVLDETLLSDEYGLSRTPLREVFQRLAGEGYLILEANRGASTSSMDLSVMRQFFQTAPMIYASVARLAAENATNKQVAHLKEAQSHFAKAVSAGWSSDMAMYNHRFHEIIGEMAGNPYLSPSLSRLLIEHTRMSQLFYRPETKAEQALVIKAREQHDTMILAIENKEPSRAVQLTLDHWDLSRDRIERFVNPSPLAEGPDREILEKVRHAI